MKQLFKKKTKKNGVCRSKTATITFAKSTKYSRPVKKSTLKGYKGLSFSAKKPFLKKSLYRELHDHTPVKAEAYKYGDRELSTQEATESGDSGSPVWEFCSPLPDLLSYEDEAPIVSCFEKT